MLAVELVDPGRRNQPLDKQLAASLNMRAWRRGAVVVTSGNVLRAAPPLSIDADEVDELANIIGASLRELQDELSRSPRTLAAASA
jgi:4-aminobutyrate aminotransferase-like enzyme